MKNILLPVLLVAIFTASCNKEPRPHVLTRAEMAKKIDSVTALRMKESDDMAARDLSHRIKIEVKVKADSILNLKMKKRAGDTVKALPVPVPGIPK